MTGVHCDRTWVDKLDEVKMLVKDFFFSRFKKATNDSEGINLDHITFPNFYELENRFLVKSFGEEEVKQAIWDCGGSKAPGSDDYNFKFIKEFWEVLKLDIMRFLCEFHTHGCFHRGANTSFIALVPKVEEP